VIGFLSFSQVTDPDAHEAYNAWHQLDHLPEQYSIDGVTFGQRWVRTPSCRAAEQASADLLEPFEYMTLYLMRDRGLLPEFFALAQRLQAEDRFFDARRSLLSGPFDVTGQWAAPHARVSPGVVPHRPSEGVYVVVGPQVDGAALTQTDGVAGTWELSDGESGRFVTIAFVDGDLLGTASALGAGLAAGDRPLEWAGPLERIDANHWDWFATLTAQ
jgi:hypothetical protein